MSTRFEPSRLKPQLQQVWNSLPEEVKTNLKTQTSESAMAQLEKHLNREIDLRGTVGAGKITGRADKIQNPKSDNSTTPAGKPELVDEMKQMLKNPMSLRHSRPGEQSEMASASTQEAGPGSAAKSALSGVEKQVNLGKSVSQKMTRSSFAKQFPNGINLRDPEVQKGLESPEFAKVKPELEALADENGQISTDKLDQVFALVDTLDSDGRYSTFQDKGTAGKLNDTLKKGAMLQSPVKPGGADSNTPVDGSKNGAESKDPVTKPTSGERLDPKPSTPETTVTPVKPEGTDIRKAQLDLSKPFSVRTVQTALDVIANERGESGGIDFHIEGSAKVYGPAKAGAWADLGLQVEKDDTGATTLSFNFEAAAKAGIDLGIFKVEGAVGLNGSVKARFNNSADAAAWLTHNFHKINQKADGKLFQIQGHRFHYSQPTIINEQGGFVQGKVETKFGPFEVTGTARGQSTSQTFVTPDGKTYKGKERSLSAGVEGEMKFGKVTVNGKYKFNQFTQTGDPTMENNGKYRNHQVSFNVSLEKLKEMSPDEIRGAVWGLALMNTEGLSSLGQAAHNKMIESVVRNLEHIKKNPPAGGLTGSIGIRYEAQNVLENGEYNNQYQRIFLDLEGGLKAGFDAKVAEGEVSLMAHKSEMLAEWVGTNTESYASQVFSRGFNANGRNPDWKEFRQTNRGPLEQILKNRVQNNPNDPVAQAYTNNGVDAGIDALENSWQNTQHVHEDLRKEAATIASYGNQWRFDTGEEAIVLRMMDKYKNQPARLTQLLEYMEGYGMSRDTLYGKTGGFWTQNDERMKAHFDKVDNFKRTMERQGLTLSDYL